MLSSGLLPLLTYILPTFQGAQAAPWANGLSPWTLLKRTVSSEITSQEAQSARDYFYVGGQYVPADPATGINGTLMTGQMYVERLLPKDGQTQKYPLVLWESAAQTGTNWLNTPDGREGWASYFLNKGYVVYIVDQPQRGRSPWEINQGSPEYLTAETLEQYFTASQDYDLFPAATFHTQFPGTGRRGDPAFDALYASQVQMQADESISEPNNRAAGVALVDKIGDVILVMHSQAGAYGWDIGDSRPDQVKGILAIEPTGPPFESLFNPAGPVVELPYGLTMEPLAYDPPLSSPDDLVRQTFPPAGANLSSCIRQAEPARKLANLSKIPVMFMTSQASPHAAWDGCTVAYMQQAGVDTKFLNLTDAGIFGNSHFMFMEENNLEIAPLVDAWFQTIP